MNKFNLFFYFFIFLFFFNIKYFNTYGSENKNIKIENKNLKILVSIYPQKYILEKIINTPNSIGKRNNIKIEVLVPKNNLPENYSPSIKQLKNITNISFYFQIGLPLEQIWFSKIKNQNDSIKLINMQKDINHIKDDPHIWLSLKNLLILAKNTYEELKKILPLKEHILLTKNWRKFNIEIKKANKEISSIINESINTSIAIYHPSLTYYSRDYSLNQISIENEGKEPTIKELINIIKKIKKHKINILLIQPEINTNLISNFINEFNGQLETFTFSPLEENIIQNLKKITKKIFNKNEIN